MRQTDEQTDGLTDRRMDRQMDGRNKWHIEVGAPPKKLGNTEAELKKVLLIKKACILLRLYNLNDLVCFVYF